MDFSTDDSCMLRELRLHPIIDEPDQWHQNALFSASGLRSMAVSTLGKSSKGTHFIKGRILITYSSMPTFFYELQVKCWIIVIIACRPNVTIENPEFNSDSTLLFIPIAYCVLHGL